MAREAARFAARLKKQLGLSVQLVDERLSSWEAKQVLEEKSARRGRRVAGVDAVAAAVVLRAYLERAKARAQARG